MGVVNNWVAAVKQANLAWVWGVSDTRTVISIKSHHKTNNEK